MSDEIRMRRAGLEELDIIVQIFKNAIKVMNEAGIFQWDNLYPNEDILKRDILDNQMFLCEIDNQIVSIFALNQESDIEYEYGEWQYEASFFIIHRLCVNPVFQGRGIGSFTVQLIENYLREMGIESIRLDAFSQNSVALRMYERLGYSKVGEVNFRKGVFYLYEKKLQKLNR